MEIAAVRVRDRRDRRRVLVAREADGAIEPDAAARHGISRRRGRDAPTFAELWPRVRAFCGDDMLVAHNGYDFDFPILERLAGERCSTVHLRHAAARARSSSDERKPRHLARSSAIDRGRSHRALDDTRTLAQVFLALRALNERVRAQDGAGEPARPPRRRARAVARRAVRRGGDVARPRASLRVRPLQHLPRGVRRSARARGDDTLPDACTI